MAKKKTSRKTTNASTKKSPRSKTEKSPRSKTEKSPRSKKQDADAQDDQAEVCSAADAVRAAQDELRRAEAHYRRVREQATEKMDEIRQTTIGEVLDGALEVVRQHPGPSLLAAVALGFMLDRWMRK